MKESKYVFDIKKTIYGWMGKALRIDLSTHQISELPLNDGLTANFLGGRGVGVKIISERCSFHPFDPEMALVFATGPLTNSGVPTSGRWSLISKSPLTGTIFDCSCGGTFGHHLKAAGYDYMVISGKSYKPVYIDIGPDKVAIEDASHLWGETTSETIKSLNQKGSVAAVGPAAEKSVLFANIVSDYTFCAGRGGLGAVMANKKLKAIVVRGDKKIQIADKAKVKKANKDILRLLKATPAIWGPFGLREFGTAALVDLLHMRRMMPTENFKKTFFPDSHNFSGDMMTEKYQSKKHACYSCPIACKKKSETGTSIPEFETVSHFGALNNNGDLASIVEANRLCNELGLDTISTAATISAYLEITGEKITPLRLLELVRLIGYREGIGDELAEGSRKFTASHGCPSASMTCKSLELPAYDPRGAYGMALAYATSNRGGCHLRAYPISHEILRKPVATDRFSFEGKARIIKIAEDVNAAIDSLVACKFAFFGASLEEYALALSGATGQNYDAKDLEKIGERIYMLERLTNCLLGFSRKDDNLPERFFKEEGSSEGNIKIPALDRNEFEQSLLRYYHIRGCDEKGIPLKEKLATLDLND